MSKKDFLNEDEINKFLARSDDEDEDSDWDDIGEVNADEYLKANSKPSSPKFVKSIEEKTPKRKDVVTFRKIKDVGIDALFEPSAAETTTSECGPVGEEEEKEYEAPSTLNASGLFVEKRLRDMDQQEAERRVEREIQRGDGWKTSKPVSNKQNGVGHPPVLVSTTSSSAPTLPSSLTRDYFTPTGTSIRVVKPRVSMTSWQDRVLNRKICALSQLRAEEIEGKLSNTDWLTVGVVAYPPDVRRSKGGTGPAYSIWRLTDLDNLERTTGLFLFGSAHQGLWKDASAGLVVALLRPRLSTPSGRGAEELKGQEASSGELTLTIDNPQQALVLGLSKDFGTCNSHTKAGGLCKRFVNKALCEYCEFHVRQLYRSSGNNRPGFSQAIGVQAKRLAGKGRARASAAAPLPPSRPKDLSTSANSQLRLLSKLGGPGASHLASHINQMTGKAPVAGKPVPPAPSMARAASDSAREAQAKPKAPVLSRSSSSALSTQLTSFRSFFQTHETSRPPCLSDPSKDAAPKKIPKSEHMTPARARAIALVRAKGGVKAMQTLEKQRRLSDRVSVNENAGPSVSARLSLESRLARKRTSTDADLAPFPIGKWSGGDGSEGKRKGVLKATQLASEEELLKEIERGSKHQELVAAEELHQEERYFNSLEFREKYEQKLAGVREHPVAVVSCGVCKYRAEGRKPNDVCLREHPGAVRHGKGVRRYFVCADCKERTTSLEKIPTKNCRKCGGENFRRTGMLRERKGPKLVDETLLPRGEEYSKFLST